MNEYKPLEGERNKFAHGCFGICPDDDGLLFVIKIEHHVVWHTKAFKWNIPRRPTSSTKRKNVRVYTTKDLETIYLKMEKFWFDVFYFNGYLRNRENVLRCAEFKMLLSSRGLVT